MGHILFGLPEIRAFHLLSRVARKLASREHRVTTLTGNPVDFEFYRHQGLACLDLQAAKLLPDHLVPVQDFAAIDCRLAGHRSPTRGQLARAQKFLEQRVPGMIRLFEQDRPDLVLIPDGRTGLHRLLHFVATHYDVPVIHVGPGMLPMTLQVDPEGLDADSSFARSTPQDYRRAPFDDDFLEAATAAWLGRAFPPPLAQLGLVAPPLRNRVGAVMQSALMGAWGRAFSGLGAWTQAQDLPRHGPAPTTELPRGPFLCVLLQDREAPARRLDAGHELPAREFIHSAWQAMQRVDPDACLVVVEPREYSAERTHRDDYPDNVHFVPQSAAPIAVITALAVVTVNHPLALAAILSDTPVLHTADAPYGLPGVTTRTDGTQLAEHLALAMRGSGQPTLRRRFLTRVLKDHHIWCPHEAPDSNGVAGIVLSIEKAIGDTARAPIRYRAGPVWPLALHRTQNQRRTD